MINQGDESLEDSDAINADEQSPTPSPPGSPITIEDLPPPQAPRASPAPSLRAREGEGMGIAPPESQTTTLAPKPAHGPTGQTQKKPAAQDPQGRREDRVPENPELERLKVQLAREQAKAAKMKALYRQEKEENKTLRDLKRGETWTDQVSHKNSRIVMRLTTDIVNDKNKLALWVKQVESLISTGSPSWKGALWSRVEDEDSKMALHNVTTWEQFKKRLGYNVVKDV